MSDFADGHEDTYRRSELTIFKHTDAEIPGAPEYPPISNVSSFFAASSVHRIWPESRSFPDVDRRGFYFPPAALHWSLAGVPEQLETDQEECYWEIEKFIRLAFKANPNILECLYSPLVETCTPLAKELIEAASHLSFRATFTAPIIPTCYPSSKIGARSPEPTAVSAGNTSCILSACCSPASPYCATAMVPVRVDEHRERLLSVRRARCALARSRRLAPPITQRSGFEPSSPPPFPNIPTTNSPTRFYFVLVATPPQRNTVNDRFRATEKRSRRSSVSSVIRHSKRCPCLRIPVPRFRLRSARRTHLARQ